jgi:hypothetical protein
VWLAILGGRARRQRVAKQDIVTLGGIVFYDHQMHPNKNQPSRFSRLLASVLGDDYVYCLTGVQWHPPPTARDDDYFAVIDAVSELPHLESLAIWPPDANAKAFGTVDGGLTDISAQYLVNRVGSLRVLSLTSAKLTDSVVQSLIDNKNWRSIQIYRHREFGGDRAVDLYEDKDGYDVHWTDGTSIRIPEWRTKVSP